MLPVREKSTEIDRRLTQTFLVVTHRNEATVHNEFMGPGKLCSVLLSFREPSSKKYEIMEKKTKIRYNCAAINCSNNRYFIR